MQCNGLLEKNEWVTNETIKRTRISILGFSFFKFQYNLYMSDTLVSEAMASSTGSEEHQTSSSSMMFKPVSDIQSRLGKVLYTSKNQQKTKKQKHIQNLKHKPSQAPQHRASANSIYRLTYSQNPALRVLLLFCFVSYRDKLNIHVPVMLPFPSSCTYNESIWCFCLKRKHQVVFHWYQNAQSSHHHHHHLIDQCSIHSVCWQVLFMLMPVTGDAYFLFQFSPL